MGYTRGVASPLDTQGAPTGASATPPLPEPANVTARRARLRTMRWRATSLLVAFAAVFIGLQLWDSDAAGIDYLESAIEAGMVGGLADWFAVVVLFRHPLGVPIPHTAIIPTRKQQFGETLGDFVQSSFLTPDAIVARVRSARVTRRLAAWLADPRNAERLARYAADAAVTGADLLRDEEVHQAIEDAARKRLDTTPLAPLAGRTLELLTEDGRHQEVLEVVLRAVDRFLTENQASLRARFGSESPWWLPGAAEDRIFERLLDGARAVLADVVADPGHELRRDVDARVRRLVADLQSSPELIARGEELKAELLAQPELREWVARIWRDLKAELRAQADDPDSELRHRLAGAIAATGARLRDDPALAGRTERALETGARYVAEQFSDEIGDLVATTVARWDAHETADRLELLLGPDLQFIRINGTLVGAAAGLALHGIAQVLG